MKPKSPPGPKPATGQVRVESSSLTPGLRRFLYVTAAITGAAVMVVEILGAKMLSPYVGTSHFVWTAQIAVTLVALATGYYVGGWWVDRSMRPGRIYAALLVAALYLTLTVAIREPVAFACLRHSNLALGSLLASGFLYFIPLSLLAMVGPFFIRVLTSSLANVGGTIGRLSAISTLGSVVGTILIGYILIPFLPNSMTMYLTSVALAVLAVVYFVIWGRQRDNRIPAIGVALLVAGLGYAAVRADRWAGRYTEVFRGNSDFGMLQVLQDKESPRRLYLNDYLTQNTYDTTEKKSTSMFTYMLHGLATAYAPKVENVLCIGMGVGIVPMEFARDGAKVDVVEINPAVVPVARDYFDFQLDKVRLFIADGRQFLNEASARYDAIVLDAFLGDSCPSHLMTREAFQAMRRALRPDGVLVINTFAKLEGEDSFFGASLQKTLASAFPSVKIHAQWSGGNTFFVASARTNLVFMHVPSMERVYHGSKGLVEDAYTRLWQTDPSRGRILTDDFNPVEFYDAPNREQTRRNLIEAVQERL